MSVSRCIKNSIFCTIISLIVLALLIIGLESLTPKLSRFFQNDAAEINFNNERCQSVLKKIKTLHIQKKQHATNNASNDKTNDSNIVLIANPRFASESTQKIKLELLGCILFSDSAIEHLYTQLTNQVKRDNAMGETMTVITVIIALLGLLATYGAWYWNKLMARVESQFKLSEESFELGTKRDFLLDEVFFEFDAYFRKYSGLNEDAIITRTNAIHYYARALCTKGANERQLKRIYRKIASFINPTERHEFEKFREYLAFCKKHFITDKELHKYLKFFDEK